MLSNAVIAASLLLFCLGCGGDPPCRPVSTEEPTEGLIRTFAALPQTGCDPGALKGLDPRGLWFVTRGNGQPFGGSGPVTIAGECGDPYETTFGLIGRPLPYETTLVNNSYWFWRTRIVTDNGEIIRAFSICAGDEDELVGHYRGCFFGDGFEQCTDDTLTMRRFGTAPDEPQADGLSLVSEYLGADWQAAFTANVRVKDGIAYIARGRDALRIIDVSNPAEPFELGSYSASADFFNDVKIADAPDGTRYVLVASDTRGVLVLDVSDPSSPTLAATFTPGGEPQHGVHTIFIDTFEGKTAAFIVDGFSAILSVYDITDPASPIAITTYDERQQEAGAYHDLYVEDGIVYLNATVDGFSILDLTQAEPVLGQFDSGDYSHSNWVTQADGRRIAVHGGEGYDAHVQIVDVDPDSATYMQRIGEWQSRPEVSVHNIVASGDRAYLAHYEDGVRVLDLSDPTSPELIAHYNTWSSEVSDGSYLEGTAGIDVHEEDDLLYATDLSRGLVILRLPP